MKLWPVTIMGRTLGVMLAGIVVVAGILLTQFYWERQAMLAGIGGWHMVTRIADVARDMEAMPAKVRLGALDSYQGAGFRVTLSADSPVAEAPLSWRGRLIRDAMESQFGSIERNALRIGVGELTLRHPMRPSADTGRTMHRQDNFPRRAMVISLRLTDGMWLNFATPSAPQPALWGSRFLWLGAPGLLIVVAVSIWAVRRATQPLRLFAYAAERLGVDFNAKPLAETGPHEVRRAAKAFNLMQQRLQTFVHNRTNMLAAISHDLRTPITRLKLRVEFVGDEEQRQKMLSDLDEMEAMIATTLQFARDDVMGEPAAALDLAALVRKSAEDENVKCICPDTLSFTGRPIGLKRLVNNLLGNATRYAQTVEVELSTTDVSVVLNVRDDGPGIPEEMLERVFEPFVRVEGSRSRETGGVGLGLAAVRSIVLAHGGEVTLINRDGGGLDVCVMLPCG